MSIFYVENVALCCEPDALINVMPVGGGGGGGGGGGEVRARGWGFDLTHSPVGKEFDVLSCSGGDAI